MKELVLYIVRKLVDNPESVKIKEVKGEQNIILELSTAKEDIGKVIGKQGRTIKAPVSYTHLTLPTNREV